MASNKKYTVLPTYTFKEELKNITSYFKYRLKEPLLTKRFYKNVSNKIKSLEFMPEKQKMLLAFTRLLLYFTPISIFYCKSIVLSYSNNDNTNI